MFTITSLNKEQILSILDTVKESDTLGKGTSRKVYKIKYNDMTCAMKVACDRQGRLQNRIELSRYMDYANDRYLNPIFAYYRDYIIITGYCHPYNSQLLDDLSEGDIDADIPETFYENEVKHYAHTYYGCSSYDELLDAIDAIETTAGWFHDVFGYDDDYQIGSDDWGNAVVYDYGYTSEYPGEYQVGEIQRFPSPLTYIYDTIAEGDCNLLYDIDRYLTEGYEFDETSQKFC